MGNNVGLNDYERYYFDSQFKGNLKRLKALRKSIAKSLEIDDYNADGCYVTKTFVGKGGKRHFIRLSKKKVDKYIEQLKEGKI
jgi:hypothetical protein